MTILVNRSQAVPTQGSINSGSEKGVMPTPSSRLQTLMVSFAYQEILFSIQSTWLEWKGEKTIEYFFLCSVGKWKLDSEVFCTLGQSSV